jgi:hypothetical protein
VSRLQFFNYFFAQWFGIRIARSLEFVGDKYKILAWGVIFVWPMSGWGTAFKPAKPKFRRIFYTTRGRELAERKEIADMVETIRLENQRREKSEQ